MLGMHSSRLQTRSKKLVYVRCLTDVIRREEAWRISRDKEINPVPVSNRFKLAAGPLGPRAFEQNDLPAIAGAAALDANGDGGPAARFVTTPDHDARDHPIDRVPHEAWWQEIIERQLLRSHLKGGVQGAGLQSGKG